MGAHVLLPLTVNRKSKLTPLGLDPANFCTPAHLSERSAQSHPKGATAEFVYKGFTVVARMPAYFFISKEKPL
jgi:hypothetical protein